MPTRCESFGALIACVTGYTRAADTLRCGLLRVRMLCALVKVDTNGRFLKLEEYQVALAPKTGMYKKKL